MSPHNHGPFVLPESDCAVLTDPNEPDGLTPLDTLKALVGAARLAGYGVKLEPGEVTITCKRFRLTSHDSAPQSTRIYIDDAEFADAVYEVKFEQRAGEFPTVDLKLLP